MWAGADDLAWASKAWQLKLASLRGKASLWEGGLFGRLTRSPEAIAAARPGSEGGIGGMEEVRPAFIRTTFYVPRCYPCSRVRFSLSCFWVVPDLLRIHFARTNPAYFDWRFRDLVNPTRSCSACLSQLILAVFCGGSIPNIVLLLNISLEPNRYGTLKKNTPLQLQHFEHMAFREIGFRNQSLCGQRDQ